MALLISWRPSSASNISFPFIVKKTSSSKSVKMGSFGTNNISCCVSSSASTMVAKRKLPILLFDVMDTIVRDPFYHDVPAFFRYLVCLNFSLPPFTVSLLSLKIPFLCCNS